MNPQTKESLLWGLVGAFSFLVLVQGYELFTAESVTLGVKIAVALLVGVAAGVSTTIARKRLLGNESA